MTRFLLATASVHTTAAACDYLTGRLEPGDEVHVLTVHESGNENNERERRDAADAVNVASVRLPGADVRPVESEGEPAAEILACAEAVGADELLLAARDGPPGAGAGTGAGAGAGGAAREHPETGSGDRPDVGATARRVLAGADRPVVVVPLA